ncbi:Altered inheritance of mitochondria protein 6-like protein [Lachnellula hyalina]|uniref:Altered inheritance of mitochondria protein 6 n=1 Tax=Lachnellula hyalina TaxID=1316788 RepID=A0A8H8QYV4_9HELO|nr:Altered inheritance of mitochondria protein 6-like protein [Lachnellula hyalina]TVY25253.1 Altered inheritance of mitochondria protein 6-like protein [Lachnellula hyalina]
MAHPQLAEAEESLSSFEDSLRCRSSSSDSSWKNLPRVEWKQYIRANSAKKFYRKSWFYVTASLLVLGVIATLSWLSLALSLPQRNKPRASSNRVNSLVEDWNTPEDSVGLLSPWNIDFTKGIVPLQCHSHNDYFRAVPLFEALAAGCTGVEADIHLPTKAGSEDLLVGHASSSLSQDRTLQKLYIQPLITILENLNNVSAVSDGSNWNGIFQSSPNTTLIVLLDFKSNGIELWPYVNQQLEGFRSKGWLTHWNSSTGITWAPIIVVASGNAPFNLLNSNTTYRDIFYDAPLDDISNPIYDNTNSYYASVSMPHALGKQWLWKFSPAQLAKMNKQINAASMKGLKARYWETPTWPVNFKDYVSGILIENGIGMLNVDAFSSTLYFPLLTKFGQNRLVW